MSSYWVQPAGIVIDPLVPDEGLDAFDGLQQVVLTTGLHSRHAQRFADAVDHGGEELRFFSDELLGDDPEAVKDGLRAGLRRLLERDFRHVLFAHGDPPGAVRLSVNSQLQAQVLPGAAPNLPAWPASSDPAPGAARCTCQAAGTRCARRCDCSG